MRKWVICGLLFLATMMMYMDRQTLAVMSVRITKELALTNQQYGSLEMFFGFAFALGAIVNGLIADRVNVRWLYPLLLVGWSLAGVATAWSDVIGGFLLPAAQTPGVLGQWLGLRGAESDPAYAGLLLCRTALGFFEAGHWPCALITTQRLLVGADRTLGNSILQGGASVGAVLTPIVIWAMLTDSAGSWRTPFVVIGLIGMVWVAPWLLTVRGGDLLRPAASGTTTAGPTPAGETPPDRLLRRILVLLAIVIPINMTWQYFRAWMVKFLQEEHGYSEQFVFGFNSAYFLVADLGCIAAGLAVKRFASRGAPLHLARTGVFFLCAMLTILSAVAAQLSAGWLLLGLVLAIGFGSLGMFPIYYSLGQEISAKRQGLVTGGLGASTWIITSIMQYYVGKSVDQTHSYASGLFWVGQAPLIGLFALALFWEWERDLAHPGGAPPAKAK